MKKKYKEYLDWTYFGKDALDQAEFERFADLLEGINRFIDVGASHGVYTYHANRILSGADILAIEADPERFEILEENVSRWGAESPNQIHAVHAAASDEVDRQKSPSVTFYTTGTQISGGLFAVQERSDRYSPHQVDLITLDDFFDPEAKTLIKIDVEGAELRVLKGATRHIEAKNTIFFTEISWWGDRERKTNLLDFLSYCFKSGLRLDRRLRSDYLLSPEANPARRAWSIVRCLSTALLIRLVWNRLVPMKVRRWRERRENRRRLARYFSSGSEKEPPR